MNIMEVILIVLVVMGICLCRSNLGLYKYTWASEINWRHYVI